LGILLVVRKSGALIRTVRADDPLEDCGPDCSHLSAADPALLSGGFDRRRAWAALLAIGIRPCTGALVVLVFALAQGMLWAGIAATFVMALGTALTVTVIAVIAVTAKSLALRMASIAPTRSGVLALRGLELTAAFVVLGFGAVLLGSLIGGGPPAG